MEGRNVELQFLESVFEQLSNHIPSFIVHVSLQNSFLNPSLSVNCRVKIQLHFLDPVSICHMEVGTNELDFGVILMSTGLFPEDEERVFTVQRVLHSPVDHLLSQLLLHAMDLLQKHLGEVFQEGLVAHIVLLIALNDVVTPQGLHHDSPAEWKLYVFRERDQEEDFLILELSFEYLVLAETQHFELEEFNRNASGAVQDLRLIEESLFFEGEVVELQLLLHNAFGEELVKAIKQLLDVKLADVIHEVPSVEV